MEGTPAGLFSEILVGGSLFYVRIGGCDFLDYSRTANTKMQHLEVLNTIKSRLREQSQNVINPVNVQSNPNENTRGSCTGLPPSRRTLTVKINCKQEETNHEVHPCLS
jgi:hypothetical protein